jgi:hypothetical protein
VEAETLSPFAGVVLIFSALVIVLDVLAAVVSLRTGLRYEAFGIAAFAVYGWCGYLLGGIAGPVLAASGTGTVALVEATLGWAIAWRLGPGRPDAPSPRRRDARGFLAGGGPPI